MTVHGLMNGTTYYFQVRAVNDLDCTVSGRTDGCNEGQESLEVDATPFGKPVTRVDLTMATPGDRRVTLEWDPVPDPPTEELSGFQYRQKAGGGYGSWLDIRNSDASTTTHVVAGLTNGTTYTFQVRAANSSGGGLVSNERSAVPSTTPGAPTLTATAGDKEVRLTWTPAASGGGRITKYECRLRIGADEYLDPPCVVGKSLSASATSLTLTDEDVVAVVNDDDVVITNGTTYTFQVRAVNARPDVGEGIGDWSNEASARPTDTSGERSYTISATIDGKSWAKASPPSPVTLLATVEVNPRLTAQSTTLWVDVDGAGVNVPDGGTTVEFGPTNSSRDASFRVTPSSAGYLTIALFTTADEAAVDDGANALAVTRVEIRPRETRDPPTGLEARRGDGEVTLSWATDAFAQDVFVYRVGLG